MEIPIPYVQLVTVITLTVGGAVVAYVLLRYLRGTVKVNFEETTLESDSQYEELRTQLANLQETISSPSARDISLTNSEKRDLVARLKSEVESLTADDILRDITENVASTEEEISINSMLKEHFVRTLSRLEMEIEALGRRGNLNLVLGIITTISGLLVLGYAVFYGTPSSKDPLLVASYYLPRISLVLLIELFAYFFLNLYKTALTEIKYFQNETTNVEAKYAALQFALSQGNEESINEVVRSLAQTERNFTLKKGETTVELERNKLDSESGLSMRKTLSDILNRNKNR